MLASVTIPAPLVLQPLAPSAAQTFESFRCCIRWDGCVELRSPSARRVCFGLMQTILYVMQDIGEAYPNISCKLRRSATDTLHLSAKAAVYSTLLVTQAAAARLRTPARHALGLGLAGSGAADDQRDTAIGCVTLMVRLVLC